MSDVAGTGSATTPQPPPAPATVHPAYNAVVREIRHIHDSLMVMRVQPDDTVPPYEPGQFATLGLYGDERRIDESVATAASPRRLIRRVYSISCPILDPSGELCRPESLAFLEYYIALVRRPDDSPPALTPRLFAMEAGHRMYMSTRAKGSYTLHDIPSDADVLFAATGTGEAPHNAMIRALLAAGHTGLIASFVCVRRRRDLAYLSVHRELEKRFSNYRYIPLTTREPENLDPDHPDFVGKLYLQDVFASASRLTSVLGRLPDPAHTHVFLCGNPAMIGAPRRAHDGSAGFPDPQGMIETLVDNGYQLSGTPGEANIHFERYW